MTTSGTTTFNLDLAEILEEAFERAGGEMRSGYDYKTARRSLNMLLAEWSNQGVNLWTVDQGTITLTPGLNTYALPVDTVDLLDHVIRTNANSVGTQADLTITRVSSSTYATIPNKLTQARPIQIWVQRQAAQVGATTITLGANITAADTTITLSSTAGLPSVGFIQIGSEYIYYNYVDGVTLGNCFRGQNGSTAASHTLGDAISLAKLPSFTVWPTPDNAQTYQVVYWRMRRIQDAGNGTNTMDIPFRFLPALVAGLAYYIALKIPNGMTRLDVLKAQYEESWLLASGEDRERASVMMVPRQMYI